MIGPRKASTRAIFSFTSPEVSYESKLRNDKRKENNGYKNRDNNQCIPPLVNKAPVRYIINDSEVP